MAVPHILARSFSEAHAFARGELGLKHGQYRVVTSAGTIKSLRNVDLYLAPNWRRRFDGFTMESALRWTRMNVIDVEKQRAEEPAAVDDDLDPPGQQLVLVSPEEAAAFFETSNGDNMISEGGPVAPEPVEAPVEETKRRRRRCKECGILVEPDEVESHAKEHLPVEVG